MYNLSSAICSFPSMDEEVVRREESWDITYFALSGCRPHFMELLKVLSSLVPFFWSATENHCCTDVIKEKWAGIELKSA